ncbi:MAG: hypothetical protein ACQEVA_01770 [Myxococcota bacterium]
MIRLRSRHAWIVVLTVAWLSWAPTSGCATSDSTSSGDEDEFVGQPPSPEDDPFSVRGDVRAEAVSATPQGAISEEDFEEPTPRDDLEANPDEWDEALGSAKGEEPDEQEPQVEASKPDAESEPEPESQPEPESKPEPEPLASRTPPESSPKAQDAPEPSGVRCFSCVKICPLEGDCASAKKDVICGWGTHSTRDQAARLARAECDATLDMARQMPVWSRIEGSCPAATCSE